MNQSCLKGAGIYLLLQETGCIFVRNNPRSVWKKEVGPFVDAQIIMANRFCARLAKTEG